MHPHIWLVTGLVLGSASAQTLVVGAGGTYAQISAAVAAAPSGATILVRAGTYQGFAVVGKSLTILCDAGAYVAGEVSIAGIAATQSVTLAGLTWDGSWIPTSIPAPSQLPKPFELASCQGRVVLDGIDATAAAQVVFYLMFPLSTQAIAASGCTQLVIRNSLFRGDCALTNCTTAIESSTFTGTYLSTSLGQSNTPGLQVLGGSLRVGGASSFQGAQGYYPGNPFETTLAASAGLSCLGANVQFAAGTATSIRTSFAGDQGGIHMYSGQLRLARRAVVNAVTGAYSGVPIAMPAVSATGSLATGALSATVLSEPGDLAIVLFGLTGAPVLATPLADPFWLDPNAFEFHAIAVQPAGPLSASVNLPPNPGLRGLVVTWQVVASGPATGFAASNPAIQVVR